jgi:KUP system potassium uptake protein
MPNTVIEADSVDAGVQRTGTRKLGNVVKEAVNEAVVENAALTDEHGHPGHGETPHGSRLALLSLAALGIVYGDIGTSVLYSLRECFHGPHAIPATPVNVYGVLSLVFWSLLLVVTIKYVIFILQADNRGEGGILALTALATPIKRLTKSERKWLVILGVFGASLLYGDGIITPAISVLSAVEGLTIAKEFFDFAPYVVPITIAILIGLFAIQRHGTATVGKLFGPVMVIWFATLAVLGISQIMRNPAVLSAANPLYAFNFFRANGWVGFFVLGTVFLVVTGGEALYADMGHFGRRPIRIAWFAFVLPALLLNYAGQGALLLSNPEAAQNPFYLMAPSWALYPLVGLATLATVIASQALISGAFSITMQAVQLGFLPRLQILHTSRTEFGQIYIPAVNWLLMASCILIVLGFRTSSNLAAAYGIAVTSTMAITTIIFYIVALERWKWSHLSAGALAGFFFIIDFAFLAANVVKIPHGGWFPLVVAVLIFTVMTTWKLGRHLVAERVLEHCHSLEEILEEIKAKRPARVPGTAIFLSSDKKGAPAALIANLDHNSVLHEQVIILTVETKYVPHVPEGERLMVEPLGDGMHIMTLTYGFMDEPDVQQTLAAAKVEGLNLNPQEVTFFVSRAAAIASKLPGMARWRDRIFAFMSRNAATATDYFCLPPARVIEIGSRVEF